MKNSKGITLTSLIVTIIVMMILAGIALVFSAGEEGIITRTQEAKDNQKYTNVEEKIKTQSEYISEGKNIGKIDLAKLESNIKSLNLEEVEEINTTPNLLTVKLKDDRIIEIPGANGSLELNEYGFYYNVDYVCYDFFGYGDENEKFSAKILEDGTFKINVYQDGYFNEGGSIDLKDITGNKIIRIEYIEYNKTYTKIGPLDAVYTWVFNGEDSLTTNVVINKDKMIYSDKNINIGGVLNCVVSSEDGKSFTLNGKVFEIEE